VAAAFPSGIYGVAKTIIQRKRKANLTAKDKIASRKLSLLELASDLANVSRACKLINPVFPG